MSRLFVALALTLVISGGATAASHDTRTVARPIRNAEAIHGNVVGTARSEVDTFYLLGGPGRWDGRFEDPDGQPNWHGWTHIDQTYFSESVWQVSDFMAPSGQYAMWCGKEFDGDPGYGNYWYATLVFTQAAAVPVQPSTVIWTATLRHDVERDNDYVRLQVNRGGQWDSLLSFDDVGTASIEEAFVVAPEDYVGVNGDEIQIRVLFDSDNRWSDADGLRDSDGACQYDDVTVIVDGIVVDSEDFEDQVSDRWIPTISEGVGDFTALRSQLTEIDPCLNNQSFQVSFFDDGLVVPGTGGTPCVTWCYGPGGYIVNNTGGLLGPEHYVNNLVISPVLDWPEGCDNAWFSFDVYRHEELGEMGTWPGMFYQLEARGTADPENAPIQKAEWSNDNRVIYGGPGYFRESRPIGTLLPPDRVQIQVAFRLIEYGYTWGWVGEDGTPAPYFDNVSVVAHPFSGPTLEVYTYELANDNFPASGTLDLTDLAANSVRFDMAANNNWHTGSTVITPGDSVAFRTLPLRGGWQIVEPPLIHVQMMANPVFDEVRALPPGFIQNGAIISGIVDGVWQPWFDEVPGLKRWGFDLPDTGFFFPGDVIHYFLEARDDIDGDIGSTIAPADTSGFTVFTDELRYDSNFTVRALPSVRSETPGDQPPILFWNDFGSGKGEAEWQHALRRAGLREGIDYDRYFTHAASSGVGSGLGGRATSEQLAGYDILLYSAGRLTRNLLSNGDIDDDPSDDLAVVSAWFAQGDKNAFMTGDNIVSGHMLNDPAGEAFVATYFNVELIGSSISNLIGGQAAPQIRAVRGNGVIHGDTEWIAYGVCPQTLYFDACQALPGTTLLAEFTDPAGQGGVHPYAAAFHHSDPIQNANVVVLPMDLAHIRNAPGWIPPDGSATPVRAAILMDVLGFFGMTDFPPPVDVSPDAVLRVRHYPNPFNPTTIFALDLPRAGDVRLRIYDLRGALVRTLVDERLAAGRHEIPWNGTDDRGATVASGVYFSEVRAAGEVKVQKLALVK